MEQFKNKTVEWKELTSASSKLLKVDDNVSIILSTNRESGTNKLLNFNAKSTIKDDKGYGHQVADIELTNPQTYLLEDRVSMYLNIKDSKIVADKNHVKRLVDLAFEEFER